jgi:hypothetical protein
VNGSIRFAGVVATEAQREDARASVAHLRGEFSAAVRAGGNAWDFACEHDLTAGQTAALVEPYASLWRIPEDVPS